MIDINLADNFNHEEECYIDDIPFETEDICEQVMSNDNTEDCAQEMNKIYQPCITVEVLDFKYVEHDSYALIRY